MTPLIEFVRAIPPPALIPFGIVVLGVGVTMKVFIILMVSLFPVLMHTIDGVRGVDPKLLDSARAYRVGGATGSSTSSSRPPRRRSSPVCASRCRCR